MLCDYAGGGGDDKFDSRIAGASDGIEDDELLILPLPSRGRPFAPFRV